MFSRVVIATDLSEASDQIVVNLSGLIPLGTREILLAHAMDIAPQCISTAGFDYNETLRGDLSRRVQARLAKLRVVVEKQGFQVTTQIVYGRPSAAIEALARKVDASLVIAGSRGASLARNVILGESALDILHHSQVPVLLKRLVKAEPANVSHYHLVCSDFSSHLLFGTDFSENAARSFQILKEIIRHCHSAVTLLHVRESGPTPFDKEVTVRLADMQRELHEVGAREIEVIVADGAVPERIIRAAEASEISLVVLGARGNSSTDECLLGNTSREVARKARVPVLIIPRLRTAHAPAISPAEPDRKTQPA